MKTGERLALAVLSFLLVAVSSPDPVHAQSFDGTWQGFTSQDLPIRFEVSGGRVTNFHAEGRVVGLNCTGTFRFTDENSTPIVDGGFPSRSSAARA